MLSLINVREYRRGRQRKNGQSRETGNIGHTRGRKTKQKHHTICVGHHYAQANTNNANVTKNETKTSRTSLLCGNRKGTQNVDT